ncbi:MAG TPA: FdhF/YdeP family oxidoreductase [Oxalicibacterium sp.]|nr:FdhF/YdeP family oxidoreductase [Oxalicibacterium sp.]
MAKKDIPGIGPYGGPAGGWGALQATAKALRAQMAVKNDTRLLLRVNQANGFDCPGCAWPDPLHGSSFEFCENGAKAVTWEATGKRAGPDFFARHTLTELWEWEDYYLEMEGRLTTPMMYDAESDRYQPVAWEEAFRRIGAELATLPDPNMAEFYTSGRASNEAAFLYQLFVREFGTNNFPDCSNLCHEATSVGLPESIGVGKGTVTLEDFDHCDAIFCIGHNPGTNHPRMLGTLREASLRSVPIVVFNPLRERGLERFANPQSPIDMTFGRSTRIASLYCQVKIGGDATAVKGMMKCLFETDAKRLAEGKEGVLDRDFIAQHTIGFDAFRADIEATPWEKIETVSGLTRQQIEQAAEVYMNAKRVILCYGMGITQHCHGTSNVQQLANLLLLRGNIGREGAGICPLRGHSNVQGDRTVGITEIPTQEFLDRLEAVFGFKPPRKHGHSAVNTVEAIRDGRSRALVCLGGNLATAMSDPEVTFPAMRKLDLAVHIATKLNRSHLLQAKTMFLLPCLGRTELDVQASGPQSVSVEDSVAMVHVSSGTLRPASDQLKSECAIVAGIAKATLPHTKVDWDALVGNYSLIRDKIEAVFPSFYDYNKRVTQPRGFHLHVAARERKWQTPSGKAHFIPATTWQADPLVEAASDALVLATIRSHDQYNTTIYSKNDRYRGITGRRDVVFMNERDLAARGLQHGDLVDVEAVIQHDDPARRRVVRGLTAVAFDIAPGSAAAYYPEANPLVALQHYDAKCGTPSYKSIPVRVRAAQQGNEARQAQMTQPETVEETTHAAMNALP